MAADSLRDGSGLKKAAFGAAGVVALRLGLRYALSGPLGVILTGAAAVSAVGYLVKHQKEITSKVGGYRKLIAVDAHEVRGDPGRLPRGPLRRRQPQPHGRRPPQALPRGDRRRVEPVERRSGVTSSVQHQRLQAADGEPHEQARTEHVLDLAAAVFGVGDDVARLVALLRIEDLTSAAAFTSSPARAAARPSSPPRDRPPRAAALRDRRGAASAASPRGPARAEGVARIADLTEHLLWARCRPARRCVGWSISPHLPHQASMSPPTLRRPVGAARSWCIQETPVMRRSPGAPPPATRSGVLSAAPSRPWGAVTPAA